MGTLVNGNANVEGTGVGVAVGMRGAGVSAKPEHAALQLRAQFSDIHICAAPRHMPCDAHDAHDGFRSTHAEPTGGCWPTKIGAGEAGTGTGTNTGAWTGSGVGGNVAGAGAGQTGAGELCSNNAPFSTGAAEALPEHAALQVRAQFSDIHTLVSLRHMPCDAHDAHDGFRSTHAEPTGGCWPTKIGAGEAGTNTGTSTGA